jgi:zinc protease
VALGVLGLLWISLGNVARGENIMKVTEVEGISEYRLANGTRVLLFPDGSKPTVTVNMTVFVGSRHEGYGEAGMAHLLEHMLFKGTPTHQNIPKVLSDRGAEFNGTTWLDRTNYYETLPATPENLEFALRLEADRLVNSSILAEDLAKEFTVVRNEFEQSENSPQRVLMQRMQGAAYEWHNYGKTTIGNRSDIERVPVDNLRKFYRKYYRPDNVLVIVAGRFEPDQALQLLEDTFGQLNAPETAIDPTYTVEPPQDGERTVVVRRVGSVQLVGASYHVPAASHPDYPAVEVLSYVLGDTPSGRMYKALVTPGLASIVFARAGAYHDPGTFMAGASVPLDRSLDEAQRVLLETLESSVQQTPVTDEEVGRAVERILTEREQEALDSQSLAISLSDWAAQGDWRLYFLFRDLVEKVTAKDVQRVAIQYLQRNNRTLGLFIPSESAQRVAVPEAPDLTEVLAAYQGRAGIAAGEAFDPEPEAIEARTERGTLVDGIRYALLPKKTRGEGVSVVMSLRYGSPESLVGRESAADMLPALMNRGTEELSFQELQDELARLRAELSISGQLGVLQVSATTKRSNLSEVLKLMGELVRKPRLEPAEFDVLKRQQISALEGQLTEPGALAGRLVSRTLAPYPPGDVRYVPTLPELIERVKATTVEQIQELHKTFLSSQAGELSIVGDFDPEPVKEQLAESFKGWSTDNPYQRIVRPPQTRVPGKTDQILTPDKANMFYYAGQQYQLNDKSLDYAALMIGDYILGSGALSSRLGDRVRQQEGLSYGVRSGLSVSPKDERGQFTIFAIANPGNRDKLMAVIREEVDRLLKDGITADELERAKAGFLESEKVKYSSDAFVAGQLASGLFLDRTLDYDVWLRQAVANLTVEQVNEILRKYIDPERLVIVVAGDFKA